MFSKMQNKAGLYPAQFQKRQALSGERPNPNNESQFPCKEWQFSSHTCSMPI